MVTAPVSLWPGLVTVKTVAGVLVAPTATVPKAPVPVRVNEPLGVAVPLTVATTAVVGALASVTVRVRVLTPAVVGLKTTLILQVFEAVSGTTHWLSTTN